MTTDGTSVDALEAIYRAGLPRFVRAATAIVGNEGDGKDAVQEAFAQAVRRRATFREEAPLEAWVWRIVINQALALRRRSSPDLASRASLPQNTTNEISEEDADVRTWIAALPERQRLAVFLALAVAVGGALFTLTLLGNSPSVLERAQAALDPNGRILHIVDRWGDRPGAIRGEAWQLPDGSLDHVVYRADSGAVDADCVISETRTRCWNRELDVIDVYRHSPPEPGIPKRPYVQYGSDWPAALSKALGSGYAQDLGATTFQGRAVFAVLLAAPGPPGPPQFSEELSHTLYLDRKTFLPVAERMPEDASTRYFDTFEFLPNNAANRAAVELGAPADAKVVVHPVGEYPPEGK